MLEHSTGAAASTEETAKKETASVLADPQTQTQTSGTPPERPVKLPASDPDPEVVRHILFGSPAAVRLTIHELHRRRYAEPNDWSQLLPTGRRREVMAILTKRVSLN